MLRWLHRRLAQKLRKPVAASNVAAVETNTSASGGGVSISCVICGSPFASRNRLFKHIRAVHEEGTDRLNGDTRETVISTPTSVDEMGAVPLVDEVRD